MIPKFLKTKIHDSYKFCNYDLWFRFHPSIPVTEHTKNLFLLMSRSQCRRRVALGTGVRQVNHSEALGGQQDSMAFIKIRLVRLFTALAVKTRKKRAIFTSEEKKTTIMLRARKKKENKLLNLQAWLTSDLDSGG